jgi:hypothetical protein
VTTPPTYRERLRVEGAALAGSGAVSAVLVLAFGDDATSGPVSTIVQLVAVAVLMATLGVRSVRRSMRGAVDLPAADRTTGEPTPLWQLPLICAGLTLAFGFVVGWDAGLRIGGGCVIVGVAQAVLFERLVAHEEVRRGRRLYRVAGSSLFTGTKLGAAP